jgi:hypothetical protein
MVVVFAVASAIVALGGGSSGRLWMFKSGCGGFMTRGECSLKKLLRFFPRYIPPGTGKGERGKGKGEREKGKGKRGKGKGE